MIVFRNDYPPSSDIGLYGNVINLILQEGRISLVNPYHMGGGLYPIPPGYHILTSLVMLFTGLPVLVAAPLVSSLLSSFIVLPAYLISRKVWKSRSLALCSGFVLIFSNLSFEMLSWGGYSNIGSLTLFAVTAYLFLEAFDSKNLMYTVLAGVFVGCIIFTHLFSFFVFFAILFCYTLVFLTFSFLGFYLEKSPKVLIYPFLSLLLGLIIALPWLRFVFNFYSGTLLNGIVLTGTEESRALTLFLRRVDPGFLLFVASLSLLSFTTFKVTRGKWIDSHSLFIFSWFIVPIALTQLYLVNIVVDYIRLVYFSDFPGQLILASALFCLSTYVFSIVKKMSVFTTKNHVKRLLQNLPLTALFMIMLIIITGFSPASVSPIGAVTKSDFYTTLRKPEYNAMAWLKQKTSSSSILASDHLYGWWLSGFAQRPTLSAVPLQYLLYPFEIERAKSTTLLLTTDYVIDNGLIQIGEDGAYFARYNPIFFIETRKGYPFSLLHFKESETTIFVQRKEERFTVDLFWLDVADSFWALKSEDSAVLKMTRENSFLKVEKTLEVHRGVRFAELSYEIRTKDDETTIDWVRFIPHIIEGKHLITQSMLGLYDVNLRVAGQVIFKDHLPKVKIYTAERVSSAEFLYTTEDVHSIKITFLIGVFNAENMGYGEVLETFQELLQDPAKIVSDNPITASGYLEILDENNIAYIVSRDQEITPKFANDPNFLTVYKNRKVTIFKYAKQ